MNLDYDYTSKVNTKLKKSIEGKEDTKNWHSGELVKDLIPEEIPDIQEGVNITDTDYQDEIYSDAQLDRHQKANMNAFTVDGIPSRWYHNQLRSKWHFDTKADKNEEPYTVMCKFRGDWESGVNRAIERCREHTIGNYRKRSSSQQDQELHDGELMDIQRASGRDDVSCMYYDTIKMLDRTDEHEDYSVFFKMLKSIGMYDVHMSRVHIQRLGQVTPFHIDQQMRYARPEWRSRWIDAGADKNPLMLRRILIQLNPWDYGHVWQFGNSFYQQYDAGECVVYDWCNIPHAASNMGYTPRITLQATGFVNEEFNDLMAKGSANHIIDV